MPDLSSFNAFICEKVLFEGPVVSAIRIVEIFNVLVDPEIPLNKQGPFMVVVALGKVPVEDDSEHVIEVWLVRPSGHRVQIGETIKSMLPLGPSPTIVPFPRGFNLAYQVGVSPQEMGLHYFSILFDGTEVKRLPFVLQPLSVQDSPTKP